MANPQVLKIIRRHFEDMAARATSYHATKSPLKKKVQDETHIMQAVANVR